MDMAALQELLGVLDDRVPDLSLQKAYYSGELPRLTLSDPHIPSYATIINQARTPWASLIVDQAAERMIVSGFRVITPDATDTDVEADSLCWDIWQSNQAEAYSAAAFTSMLLHGSAYLLVEQGDGLPVISFESPEVMAVQHAPGGRRVTAAAKRWVSDGTEVIVMWTPETVERISRRQGREYGGADVESAPGLGVVPVFMMSNRPDLLGNSKSDLAGLLPTLDRAAQSVADRITAQLYSSTKVRYLIGVEPELDEDGNPTDSTLRLATDRLLMIENPDAKAGVFDASDLRQFIEVARADVAALAALARLPSYLLSGDLVNVSREALESLSQGMVARVQQRQTWASPALSQAMRLALALAGDERVSDPRTRVEPIWAPVLEPSASDTSQAAATLVQGGILSATAAQDLVLNLTPSQREKARQYAREDALTQQGVNTIAALFEAPVPPADEEA